MQNLQIKKRDGVLELFSLDKLIASITKAGVNAGEASKIAKEVKEWIFQSGKKEIESVDIRDKVIELLAINFPAEADSYKTFLK